MSPAIRFCWPTISSRRSRYGIISGVHRYQYPAGTLLEYADCLQTDAAINPGNSGGPLFDAAGRLIGINGRGSFEKRGRVNVGVGYAISINQIKRFIGLLKSGRIVDHASLGATVTTDADGRVVVDDILDDSDAFRRGLRYGDEMVRFGGREIGSANAFKNALGTYPARLAGADRVSPRRPGVRAASAAGRHASRGRAGSAARDGARTARARSAAPATKTADPANRRCRDEPKPDDKPRPSDGRRGRATPQVANAARRAEVLRGSAGLRQLLVQSLSPAARVERVPGPRRFRRDRLELEDRRRRRGRRRRRDRAHREERLDRDAGRQVGGRVRPVARRGDTARRARAACWPRCTCGSGCCSSGRAASAKSITSARCPGQATRSWPIAWWRSTAASKRDSISIRRRRSGRHRDAGGRR